MTPAIHEKPMADVSGGQNLGAEPGNSVPGQDELLFRAVGSVACGEEDFPPLLSRPPPKENLTSSGPNAWDKSPIHATRRPHRFNLRFIPPSSRGDKVFGACSKSAVAGELVVLDYTLVGFFLGKKPAYSFVRAVLLKQWKIQGTVEILQLIHGGFAFRFSDLSDRDKILDGNVYHVGGQPMFVRQWERSLHNGGILGLKKIPLWVSLPGLPLHLTGEESLSAIGSVLGNPLYTDFITAMKNRWTFARLCVEFSGEQPLLDTVSIEDDEGNMFEQVVRYEWKPPHCLTCGVFGHSSTDCLLKHSENMETQNLEPATQFEKDMVPSNEETTKDDAQPILVDARQSKQVSNEAGNSEKTWTSVRARKKKSSGFRDHLWIPTRPAASLPKPGRFFSAAGQVSTRHGMASAPPATEKVL